MTTLVCRKEERRETVRNAHLNGIDYLEVSEDQYMLTVYFFGKAPEKIGVENVVIDGGRRVTGIRVTDMDICRMVEDDRDDCMRVWVDRFGDFSTYRLCLVAVDENGKPVVETDAAGNPRRDAEGRTRYRPMAGFDLRYACIEFSFKAGCPSHLDCKQSLVCPPEERDVPEIDYLAKDYASFRRLILDRLALIMPDWQEGHVPDLGITLVEMLAYVGDHLSYYQDAVATEAYLDTARQRISVRRHARLVDYLLHEGCNARAWVVFQVSLDLAGEKALRPDDFYLITDPGIVAAGTVHDHVALPQTLPRPYLIFEPLVEDRLAPIEFYQARNEIQIYTWDDTQCCLPKGTTSATLVDPGKSDQNLEETETVDENQNDAEADQSKQEPIAPPQDEKNHTLGLAPCDILIFEEVKGPKTGNPADADPGHRHAVRLTAATASTDPLTDTLIWEIAWGEEDALPFPVCVSSFKEVDCSPIADVSLVRGNVILVDHGESVADDLGQVPGITLLPECGDECIPREATTSPGRYRPVLTRPQVTFSEPLQPCVPVSRTCMRKLTPASAMLKQDVRRTLPQVALHGIPAAVADGLEDRQEIWEPRFDLLASGPEDRYFVVETDNDRRSRLRFGDGELGRMPDAATTFQAAYRVGSGPSGNVGAEAITHIVFRNNLPSGIDIRPRNPLPATGGTAPEPLAEARLFAPHAFRKELQRAVTADDYAAIVMRDFKHKVQRAAARLRWTGSWYEVLVAVDPLGREEAEEALLCEIAGHLHRYRRMGHDLVVRSASHVPLDIAMKICVLPHYLSGHVKAELLKVFSNRTLPDGRKGFFHPDNLTFGEGVYLSKLIAAAQAVTGVESVRVTKLERLHEGPNQEIDNGILPLGPFEVARLDNDQRLPENGTLDLVMGGGR